MLVQQRPFQRLFVYTCLLVGAVVFSFPFVWMVCSSFKVDRELFTERLEIFPNTPNARTLSPFIDQAYYRYAVTDLTKPHLDLFTRIINAAKFSVPAEVNCEAATQELTRGLARKLERILPQKVWHDPALLEQEARRAATPELLKELFDSVYRWFGVGQVRIRSVNLVEQELGKDQPFSRRFQIITPATLALVDRQDRGSDCAAAIYNLSLGDRWVLEGTFDTDFEVEQLHRIQLFMRPDDNWHRLYCFVEKLGKRYAPVQAAYPANFEWGSVTWQEPGPEDQTNKIKTWIHLKQVDQGPQYERHPRRIKITFELRRSSFWQAWWGKISRNYTATLQHIPVWRYTATSFYLVILNLILAVFSCSMVAFAIARLNWPGRDFCFMLMLATMMVPSQVTMIPGFLIWKHLGAYNTLVPLWLGAAFASPFSVFLLRQFLKGIPRDLEDAAKIDGCNYFRIYWHIMLPLVKPTLAVIAIGAFMGAWNNFMGPLVFVADQRLYPLAFGLYAFAVQVGNNPALTMAGSLLMTVPIIVVFFFSQRYFIEGVTLTGIKG